jgi:hypothetical protein
VISGKSASIDLGNLSRISEALKERQQLLIGALTQASTLHEAEYTQLVALGSLVRTIEKPIRQRRGYANEQLQYTAQSAKSLLEPSNTSQRQAEPLLLIKEQHSLLRLVTENFTLESAIFRHALRLAVSLSLGVILYSITNLPMGYWVMLTTILVLKPNLGVTFQRFFQRIGGTILGAVVAAVLISTIASKSILDIITVLTVLAVHLKYFCLTVPLPELATFVDQISLALEQLAAAVEEEIMPPPLPDLDEMLRRIQPHLQALRTARVSELEIDSPGERLRQRGSTPIRQAVIDYSILDLEIDQIVRRLSAMHSAIVRLTNAPKIV